MPEILPPIPGFNFTKIPYADLVAQTQDIPGWESELLGNSFLGTPIHGYRYGDPTRQILWVEGMVHGGHEWRTAHWVAGFMRVLHNPTGTPPATASAINYLKSRYSFYFIPGVNPDGYIHSTYQNGNGVNLNRNFDYNWSAGPSDPSNPQYRGPTPFSEPETQIVRDTFDRESPVAFLDNHTWSSTRSGFASLRSRNADLNPYLATFTEDLILATGQSDGNLLSSEPAGLASNWAGQQIINDRNCIAQTFESGGGWPADEQARVGMTGILYHMMMADSILNPPPPGIPLGAAVEWGPFKFSGLKRPVTSVDLKTQGALRRVWPR